MQTTHAPFPRPHRRPAPRQRGVVLIVALVMLTIIGLMSAAVMRNALSTDVVGDNNRRQTQATQAAQAALRHCEAQLTRSALTPAAAVTTVANERWHSFSNWNTTSATDKPTSVPTTVFNVPHAPQCMAQKRALGTDEVVVVTARGFSDNYVADTAGRTKAGSVIWLQSIIKLGSP